MEPQAPEQTPNSVPEMKIAHFSKIFRACNLEKMHYNI